MSASHNQVAKKCRLEKEAHPDRYCLVKNCLYRTPAARCPKHQPLSNQIGEQDARRTTNQIG